jgi:hypothetical protein
MASQGIWVGPHAPYGYDYVDKKLVPNDAEAANVRQMFRRYRELGSMMAVWRECAAKGVRTKVRSRRNGQQVGGLPVTRGSVRFILCNPVYKGEVTHLGTQYKGRHKPLVSEQLWSEVKELRLNNPSERNPCAPPDLLPPAVFDSFGRRMAIMRKYRRGSCERHYYSYPTAWGRRRRVPRMRANARELEKLVTAALAAFMANREHVRAALLTAGRRGSNLERISSGCETASRRVADSAESQLSAVLAALIVRVEVSTARVKVVLGIPELERFLTWDGLTFFAAEEPKKRTEQSTHLLDVPASAVRLSQCLRLPVAPRAADSLALPNPKLVLLMRQVRRAQRLVDSERNEPVAALAHRMGRNVGHFMKLLRLNYLAPDIVTAIFDGTQPPELTRRALLDADLPTDWPIQRRLFGFPEQPTLRTVERY